MKQLSPLVRDWRKNRWVYSDDGSGSSLFYLVQIYSHGISGNVIL